MNGSRSRSIGYRAVFCTFLSFAWKLMKVSVEAFMEELEASTQKKRNFFTETFAKAAMEVGSTETFAKASIEVASMKASME